ncbi:MAG TPA: TonB-dependent receptor, partial [Bryobacteraceae bacterium]|nr:TonB-dependent receptor [Bryobacteraceae bacterium]
MDQTKLEYGVLSVFFITLLRNHRKYFPYHGKLRASLGLLLALFLTAALWGQTETGQITGALTDDSGSGVRGARVVAVSMATRARHPAQTSREGEFNIPDLLPGSYAIDISVPGFQPVSQMVSVSAGSRIEQNIRLQKAAGPAQLTRGAALLRTETQTGGQEVTQTEIEDFPNLLRNPYQFAGLAGNLSEAGLGTHGAGFAINGQREDSANILLDGAGNNNFFAGSIGQPTPLEVTQEFTVLTSGFTAEFGGASGGFVNMITKSGTNEYHGAAYEFNRISSLLSNSFKDNANGTRKPHFARNQFGYAGGGPIARNRLFFFSDNEGVLVRSTATSLAWVPSPDLIGVTAPNTRDFFQSLGQLRSDARVTGAVTLNDLTAIYGRSPCTGLACATLPAGLPLFNHVAYHAPADSGGGFPQTTFDTFERIDYNLSDRTWIYGRYALYRERDPDGVLSNSPYSGYDLGQSQFDNTILASVTHAWNAQWTSQTKFQFNRLTIEQQGLTARGLVPSMYANPLAPVVIGADSVAFPGYNPFTPGSGGAFGGPLNDLQLHHDVSWARGPHLIRFGGSYDYIRDNRTDAAYQTAVDSLSSGGGLGTALNGLLSGRFAQMEVAIDPQGKFPCPGGTASPACSLTLPVSAPDFSRSNRFHSGALYAQDYWKLRGNLAVTLGVRWEHFGVQHNKHAGLDSNWYAPGAGFADDHLGDYLRNGGLQRAPESSA